MGREAVDEAFSLGYQNQSYQCASCSNPPTYKLIPKRKELDTKELARHGYMCEPCTKNLSPADYGIRSL